MGLKVGELFVNLGIKGSEKTVDALSATTKGMSNLRSVSLETKAAIVAAMYALERLMANSASNGAGLKNFEALTGLGAKGGQDLQQWQEALVNVGGRADDVTTSILAIQKAMASVDLAKGLPEGLAVISRLAGGIDFSKKDDPFYIAKAIRTAFGNAKSGPQMAAIMNYLTSSMGVSDGMLKGFHRNAFSDEALAKTHPRSQAMIDRLDKTYTAMARLEYKIGRAFDSFVAKHGEKLVSDVSKLSDSLFKLVDALTQLSEKLHVFDAIDSVVDKAGQATNAVSDVASKPSFGGLLQADWKLWKMTPAGLLSSAFASKFHGQSPTVNMYYNIEHHGDAKDTKAVGDMHKHSVKHAVKQSFGQLQGN